MMVSIRDLLLAYDQEVVLEIPKLDVLQGEILCVLGPSGSGKSSFLRTICGFFDATRGQITINGRVVFDQTTNTAVSARNVGMVFQDLCLFPHMTVAQNIGYGLHFLDKLEQNQRINDLLAMIELNNFATRFPYELSGGQQQRVAIARAIAPRPQLLLMDEPFSSLDPSLRESIAWDIRQMLKALNITCIIVTHDQREAFALADKLAVFANARCVQTGTAFELYHQPCDRFVAQFIGDSIMLDGIISAQGEDKVVSTTIGDFRLTPDQTMQYVAGDRVDMLLRPDDIIHDDSSPLKTTIIEQHFRGAQIMFTLLLNNQRLLCLAPSHHNHKVGEAMGIRAEIDHVIVYKKQTPTT